MAVYVALVLSHASCGSPRPKLGGAAGQGDLGEALELLLGRDVRAARELGASEPELGLAGVGVAGDSLGGFLSLPADECVIVLARGASGVQDLDVFAFADDGTVLGSDESSAKDANVLFCPPHPSRAFVSGRVAAGLGLFGITAQTIATAQAAALERRFGVASRHPNQSQELDSNWPGLDERLAEHRRRLGGGWESLRKLALPLDPRLYVNLSASVEADRCVDVLVMPSDEVAHLELEVLEANGRWVGSGQARGDDRHVLVCSPETRELTIRCRPHAGRGLAALVISRSAPGTAQLLGEHATRFDLRPSEPIGELRRKRSERLEKAGYARATFTHEGRLERMQRTSLSVPMGSGCARIEVLTAAPVQSVRAWLWDAAGQLVSQDFGGFDATLFACGAGKVARLDLETISEGGAFSVDVRHSVKLPAVSNRHPLATSRLLSLLNARGLLGSLDQLPALTAVELSEGELARFQLRVPSGRCLELSAALGVGTSGLEVRLFEDAKLLPDQEHLDDGEVGYGAHAATTRVCAVKPARDRLLAAELRANVGQGTALWASHAFDPDLNLKGPQGR